MRKTFATQMPDRAGAFLVASRIISDAGANITRVSYNKAIDTHTLFIEMDGTEEQLSLISRRLEEAGYLNDGNPRGKVILMEFRLEDRPGAVLEVLELISLYHFNISYISSQENGTPYQDFKIGLFIENTADITSFLNSVSRLCEVRIIHYDKSEKTLDNTVFYLSFANEIAEKLSLSAADTKELAIQSNRVMQMLDERNQSPYQTFEYISKFAEFLVKYKGDAFAPRISRRPLINGGMLHLIEPPCGSNVFILERGGKLLFIDSGFACYRTEMERVFRELFPDFDRMEKHSAITHADVDHCGLLNLFHTVYMTWEAYDNFCREQDGRPNLRETNPVHAPYCVISKLLSGYQPPELDTAEIIGGRMPEGEELFALAGTFSFEELEFSVLHGRGGHVSGECVLLCESERLAFTGDIYVNLKDMLREQTEFNRLGPFLMTNVDTDPQLAAQERHKLLAMLNGAWTLCPGHGGFKQLNSPDSES